MPSKTARIAVVSALAASLVACATTTTGPPNASGADTSSPSRVPVPTGSSQVSPSLVTPSPTPVAIPHTPAPADLKPMVSPRLKGEGVWKAVGMKVNGYPALMTTILRPAPGVYARLMWMDPKLLQFRLYAGTYDPGGTWKYKAMVPRKQRANLAATFNSGFMTYASNGGYFAYGKYHGALRKGAASVVIFTDGTATVGAWGSGQLKMGPDIAAVRQTLTLMISNGKIVPKVYAPYPVWGATLVPGAADWRSGIGVTSTGALVYVAGGNMTPVTVAQTLLRAGCVRAMSLDINPEWPAYNAYTPAPKSALGAAPHKMLTDPMSAPTRYLVPDQRDFFAAFLRSFGG